MSYTMRVTFRCDGCGFQTERDSMSAPAGWTEPAAVFGKQAGPHFCKDCTQRALSQPAALVPVEYRLKQDRKTAEAERDALRAQAELAIEAALWAGLYERDILEDPAAELHEWQGFKATWGKSEHSGDCTNQANACLRCHVELVVETAATLTTPAASQEATC